MAPSAKSASKGQTKTANAKTTSGHAKTKQTPPAATPVANRQVVLPVIPLPMMQKQQANNANKAGKTTPKHAAKASVSSNGTPASSLEAALIDRDPMPSSKGPENKANRIVEKHSPVANVAAGGATPVAVPNQAQPQQVSTQSNGEMGHDDHVTPQHSSAPSLVTPQQSSTPSVADAESIAAPAMVEEAQSTNGHPVMNHSQPQSATSSRPDFPLFQPPPPHMMHQPMMNPGVRSHHMYPQHRPQMSNGGGIMFGVLDSHTPSPALPGSFLPPPPPPMNGDHHFKHLNGHHHAHSNSNGFVPPATGHFPGDMAPISTVDAYGPVPAPAPPALFEPFMHGMNRYEPQTPHSFHGSHTSGEMNGHDGAHVQYANGAPHMHPRPERPLVHPQHPQLPPFMPPLAFRGPLMPEQNMMDTTVAYIKSQFDNKELADCVLELVSTKGCRHPVKIDAHQMILAQSRSVKEYINAARLTKKPVQVITIQDDDPYLRSDAWWMAVQRLYMHSLLEPPMNGMDFAGDKIERFRFCLGYAAAGHSLQLDDVLIRGLQLASDLVTWNTIETALGFVYGNAVRRHFDHFDSREPNQSPTALEFGYGPQTEILLAAIMSFLINEFPSNFELDCSVMDSQDFSRFPAHPLANGVPRPGYASKAGPTIARGTNTRHPSKSRLPNIKFGDLPATYPDDSSAPNRQPAKYASIMSRVLLNLPYEELCGVLSSSSNGVSGWNTAQDRYHAVSGVVAEREARRLRAVDAVRSGLVSDPYEIQQRLSNVHRPTIAGEWDDLNWEERVIMDEGPVPRIVRRWVPQFNLVPQVTPHRAAPAYDTPDSMV
ncbi:hypothetical protein GGR57DRAFT_299746 [Xylariaceae sp. FL1272]|nr:hypothetical protein GGR57DRAFT_299746 [Xylariaceae sp. FL1272]